MRRPHASGRAYRRGWAAGRDLYQQLLAGHHQLPTVAVPGLRLHSGEHAHADLVLDHARYHAADVQAVPASTMVLGPPVAMAAGYALASFTDRRARKRARRAAAPQWRDTTPTRVLTNTRTICHAEGRWLTFGHRTVVSISADLYWHTVELGFARVNALRLSGPAACWYTVALAWLLYPPDQFAALPDLADYRPQNP